MSSPQPGPPPGNASLDLEALRKQLDEDYGEGLRPHGSRYARILERYRRYFRTVDSLGPCPLILHDYFLLTFDPKHSVSKYA
jgi:hypothetical protein